MHGAIFAELKKYVDTKLGSGAWRTLLQEADVANRFYLPMNEYPDEELVALVSTASRVTGTPVPNILRDFGEFIAPGLLGMYRSLIRPEWKTLDVIHHTESTIHKVVRIKNPGAHPPYLSTSRPSPDEVVIRYTSHRKLCMVAEGIASGMAKHYDEEVSITQTRCMHRGDSECLISVRGVNSPTASSPTPASREMAPL